MTYGIYNIKAVVIKVADQQSTLIKYTDVQGQIRLKVGQQEVIPNYLLAPDIRRPYGGKYKK